MYLKYQYHKRTNNVKTFLIPIFKIQKEKMSLKVMYRVNVVQNRGQEVTPSRLGRFNCVCGKFPRSSSLFTKV